MLHQLLLSLIPYVYKLLLLFLVIFYHLFHKCLLAYQLLLFLFQVFLLQFFLHNHHNQCLILTFVQVLLHHSLVLELCLLLFQINMLNLHLDHLNLILQLHFLLMHILLGSLIDHHLHLTL